MNGGQPTPPSPARATAAAASPATSPAANATPASPPASPGSSALAERRRRAVAAERRRWALDTTPATAPPAAASAPTLSASSSSTSSSDDDDDDDGDDRDGLDFDDAASGFSQTSSHIPWLGGSLPPMAHLAPTKWRTFLQRHEHSLRLVEGAVSATTFFLPSRLGRDSELAAEAAHALSEVLALLHDWVVATPVTVEAAADGLFPSVLTSSTLQALQMGLTGLCQLELVLEKCGERLGGAAGAQDVVVWLEALKAVCRLAVLAAGGGRAMVLDGGRVPVGAARPPAGAAGPSPGPGPGPGPGPPAAEGAADAPTLRGMALHGDIPRGGFYYIAPRTGRRMFVPPAMAARLAHRQHLLRERAAAARARGPPLDAAWDTAAAPPATALHATAAGIERAAAALWSTASAASSEAGAAAPPLTMRVAGEVLHIARPLVHAVVRRRCGEASWTPWLASLSLDAASAWCTANGGGAGAPVVLDARRVPRPGAANAEEADELARRRLAWALYVMRAPLFQLVTRPVAEGVAGGLRPVPLVGSSAKAALRLLLYMQRHAFYISAS